MNGRCLAPPTLSGRPCWLCLLWALLFVFVFVGAGKGEGLFVFAWILFSELFVLGTLPPSRQIGWGGATQPHTLLSLVPCLLAAPPGCHVNKRPAFLEALGTSWLPQIGCHWPVLCTWGFQVLGFYFASCSSLGEREGLHFSWQRHDAGSHALWR